MKIVQTKSDKVLAIEYYQEHKEMIDRWLSETPGCFAHPAEDNRYPEVWKPQHWRAFMLEVNELYVQQEALKAVTTQSIFSKLKSIFK
jgi:hypothetical protein